MKLVGWVGDPTPRVNLFAGGGVRVCFPSLFFSWVSTSLPQVTFSFFKFFFLGPGVPVYLWYPPFLQKFFLLGWLPEVVAYGPPCRWSYECLGPYCLGFVISFVVCLGCIAWGYLFHHFLFFCLSLGCIAWGDLRTKSGEVLAQGVPGV